MPMFQNSYRLEPHLPFRYQVSDKILMQIMTESFKDQEYDTEKSVGLCRNVAADILAKLYKTDFDRVKYVVMISVIENTGQSLLCVTGRLWDAQRDTYSTYVFEAPTFYAVGMVVALNYE